MPPRKKPADSDARAKIVADAKRQQVDRQKGYREKAFAILPHICGRCGREFSGKTLRELTVHHKDHNHDNNPPDGSNWELLCLYCHDDEHQKSGSSGYHGADAPKESSEPPLGFRPFAGLENILKPESDESNSES